jgi:hypothetical protein
MKQRKGIDLRMIISNTHTHTHIHWPKNHDKNTESEDPHHKYAIKKFEDDMSGECDCRQGQQKAKLQLVKCAHASLKLLANIME